MKTTVVLALCSLIAACGGGSSSSSPAPAPTPAPPAASPPPPPPPPLSHVGVWTGSLDYNNVKHGALCRVTANNASPNQLVCFGFNSNGALIFGLIGVYGTVNISPPSRWEATGRFLYPEGVDTFELVDGAVTATDLTLTFQRGAQRLRHQFVGVPAKDGPVTQAGVYTYAEVLGRPISLSVDTNGEFFGQGGPCVAQGAMNRLNTFGLFIQVGLSRCHPLIDGEHSGFGIITGSIDPAVLTRSPAATSMIVFAAVKGGAWGGGYALK